MTTVEPVFAAHRPATRLPTGVLVLSNVPGLPAGSRDLGGHLGHHLSVLSEHAGITDALHALTLPTTAATAWHVDGHDPVDGSTPMLTLALALHLADHRRHDDHPVRPCLTSAIRPDPLPPDTVRIPHLVASAADHHHLRDHVVWEVMTRRRAHAWLGTELPDQAWYEARLPDLLRLRACLRTPDVITTSTAGRRLAESLTGQYLSIRFAYRHQKLISHAFTALPCPRPPTTPQMST